MSSHGEEAEIQLETSEKATKVELTEEQVFKAQRKQELKLDLDVNVPPQMLHHLPTGSPTCSTEAEESSENSMIWQRLPMGTGDVMRKRQAFEQQIKALSVDEKQSSQCKMFFHYPPMLQISLFWLSRAF